MGLFDEDQPAQEENKELNSELDKVDVVQDKESVVENGMVVPVEGNNAIRKELLEKLKTITKAGGGENSASYDRMIQEIEEIETKLQQPVSSGESAQGQLANIQSSYRMLMLTAKQYVDSHTTAFSSRGRKRRRAARALLNLCEKDMTILSATNPNGEEVLLAGSWFSYLGQQGSGNSTYNRLKKESMDLANQRLSRTLMTKNQFLNLAGDDMTSLVPELKALPFLLDSYEKAVKLNGTGQAQNAGSQFLATITKLLNDNVGLIDKHKKALRVALSALKSQCDYLWNQVPQQEQFAADANASVTEGVLYENTQSHQPIPLPSGKAVQERFVDEFVDYQILPEDVAQIMRKEARINQGGEATERVYRMLDKDGFESNKFLDLNLPEGTMDESGNYSDKDILRMRGLRWANYVGDFICSTINGYMRAQARGPKYVEEFLANRDNFEMVFERYERALMDSDRKDLDDKLFHDEEFDMQDPSMWVHLWTADADKTIEAMHIATNSSRFPRNARVFRFVSEDFPSYGLGVDHELPVPQLLMEINKKAGTVVRESNFISVGYRPDYQFVEKSKIMLTMMVDEGKKVFPTANKNETEFIFDSGLKYVILGARARGGNELILTPSAFAKAASFGGIEIFVKVLPD